MQQSNISYIHQLQTMELALNSHLHYNTEVHKHDMSIQSSQTNSR